jgi:FAD:protein FMN transferase
LVIREQNRFIGKFKALGTVCEVQLYAENVEIAQNIFHSVVKKVEDFEGLYSRYKSNSWLSKLNAQGYLRPFKLDNEKHNLLKCAKYWWEKSDGLFDPTSGVLRKIWNLKAERLPTIGEVKKALSFIGFERVNLSDNEVSFSKAGIELDFGGFGKEYLVDLISDFLIEKGVKNCLVNFGGDLRAIGGKTSGAPWQVGVSHPNDPSKPIKIYNLKDASMASSGDYVRYNTIEDKKYSHILNPRTGFPTHTSNRAVTVIANRCVDAGVLATLGMLADFPNFLRIIDNLAKDFLIIDNKLKAIGTF